MRRAVAKRVVATENEIARRMLRRAMRGVPASAPHAEAVLEWARANGTALFGLKAGQAKKLTWTAPRAGPARSARRVVRRAGRRAAPGGRVRAADAARSARRRGGRGAVRRRPAAAAVGADRPGGEAAGRRSRRSSARSPGLSRPRQSGGCAPTSIVRNGLVTFNSERREYEYIAVRWTLTRMLGACRPMPPGSSS